MPIFDEERQRKKLDTLRLKEEEDLARILSQKYGIRYTDLSVVSVNSDALRLVPEARARAAELAVFAMAGKKLSVAVRSPNNPKVLEIVEELKNRGYTPTLYMVSRASLERAWKLYSEVTFAVETKAGMIDVSNEEIARLLAAISNLEGVRVEIEKVLQQKKLTMTSRILETIIAGGLATHASDIHIEPEEGTVHLRYRLDGVLQEVTSFPHEIYRLLNSRIKLLSGLKINVKNKPQDGRFSVHIDNKEIEVRTSVLPGNYGESVVLRLLDPSTIAGELEELGMEARLLELVAKEIRKPHGMILNTGPTGSGKTTTLYAFLRRIYTPGLKIITIEDPVEYHLSGIVQTQVDHKNYTFESALRSALRQDPDVIMVGEIRDLEVASTAVHAALTGHLVLSTLHTNDAAGAFPRLVDIGIDPAILASAVNMVMAQRLVRRIIPECAQEVRLTGEKKEFVDRVLDSVVRKKLLPDNREVVWEPDTELPGCEPGFQGRIGVFEAIVVDEAVEQALKANASAHEIAAAARPQGTLTLVQDGVIKALNGITALSEVERVLGSALPRAAATEARHSVV